MSYRKLYKANSKYIYIAECMFMKKENMTQSKKSSNSSTVWPEEAITTLWIENSHYLKTRIYQNRIFKSDHFSYYHFNGQIQPIQSHPNEASQKKPALKCYNSNFKMGVFKTGFRIASGHNRPIKKCDSIVYSDSMQLKAIS